MSRTAERGAVLKVPIAYRPGDLVVNRAARLSLARLPDSYDSPRPLPTVWAVTLVVVEHAAEGTHVRYQCGHPGGGDPETFTAAELEPFAPDPEDDQ